MLSRTFLNCTIVAVILTWTANLSSAQSDFERNYDESKVPDYTLPDPLVLQDGTPVGDAETWRSKRRPELLALFAEHVYGRAPGKPEHLHSEVLDNEPQALDGLATRRQVRVYLREGTGGPAIDLLMYIPNTGRPVPAFLGLNFYGNH